jgi:hypothetical protein
MTIAATKAIFSKMHAHAAAAFDGRQKRLVTQEKQAAFAMTAGPPAKAITTTTTTTTTAAAAAGISRMLLPLPLLLLRARWKSHHRLFLAASFAASFACRWRARGTHSGPTRRCWSRR